MKHLNTYIIYKQLFLPNTIISTVVQYYHKYTCAILQVLLCDAAVSTVIQCYPKYSLFNFITSTICTMLSQVQLCHVTSTRDVRNCLQSTITIHPIPLYYVGQIG